MLQFISDIPHQIARPLTLYLIAQSNEDLRYIHIISPDLAIYYKYPLDAWLGNSNLGTQLLVVPINSSQAYNWEIGANTWSTFEISADCGYATWSPGNELLALLCENDSVMEIFLMDVEIHSVSRITNCLEQGHFCMEPSWSMDGHWFSYSRSEARSGTNTIDGTYIFNTDCFETHDCMEHQIGPINSDSNPVWSPANELVIMDGEEIQFLEIDSSVITVNDVIHTGIPDIQYLSISPDGNFLAYASTRNRTIYCYSRVTDSTSILVDGDAYIYILGWITIP